MSIFNTKFTLTKKALILIIFFFTLFSTVVLITNKSMVERLLMEERVGRLNALLDVITNQAEDYFKQYKEGILDETTAKYYVIESVTKMRYGEEGSFWVQNYSSGLVSKGSELFYDSINAKWNPKDVSDVKSEDNIPYYKKVSEFAKAGKTSVVKFKEGGKYNIIAYQTLPEWKWIFATSMEVESISTELFNIFKKQIAIATLLTILVVAIFFYLVNLLLVSPLIKITSTAKSISKGDFVKAPALSRSDEIGELTVSINTMVDTLLESNQKSAKSIEALLGVAEKVKSSALNISKITGDMVGLSNNLENTSHELKDSSDSAAASTNEVSTNTVSISSVTQQFSSNITEMTDSVQIVSESFNSLATAVEEMNISIREIANNTEKAREISSKALNETKKSRGVMEDLSEISTNINNVVKTIENITNNTNILALNAAIEAASAGEVGKGFAVVATEVKSLAKQTAQFTNEIFSKIEETNSTTEQALDSINSVAQVMEELGDISTIIANSITEQSTTVNEIFQSISGATKKAEEVARTALESKNAVKTIADNTEETSHAMLEISKNFSSLDNLGQEVYSASVSIASKSKELEAEVHALTELTDYLSQQDLG